MDRRVPRPLRGLPACPPPDPPRRHERPAPPRDGPARRLRLVQPRRPLHLPRRRRRARLAGRRRRVQRAEVLRRLLPARRDVRRHAPVRPRLDGPGVHRGRGPRRRPGLPPPLRPRLARRRVPRVRPRLRARQYHGQPDRRPAARPRRGGVLVRHHPPEGLLRVRLGGLAAPPRAGLAHARGHERAGLGRPRRRPPPGAPRRRRDRALADGPALHLREPDLHGRQPLHERAVGAARQRHQQHARPGGLRRERRADGVPDHRPREHADPGDGGDRRRHRRGGPQPGPLPALPLRAARHRVDPGVGGPRLRLRRPRRVPLPRLHAERAPRADPLARLGRPRGHAPDDRRRAHAHRRRAGGAGDRARTAVPRLLWGHGIALRPRRDELHHGRLGCLPRRRRDRSTLRRRVHFSAVRDPIERGRLRTGRRHERARDDPRQRAGDPDDPRAGDRRGCDGHALRPRLDHGRARGRALRRRRGTRPVRPRRRASRDVRPDRRVGRPDGHPRSGRDGHDRRARRHDRRLGHAGVEQRATAAAADAIRGLRQRRHGRRRAHAAAHRHPVGVRGRLLGAALPVPRPAGGLQPRRPALDQAEDRRR